MRKRRHLLGGQGRERRRKKEEKKKENGGIISRKDTNVSDLAAGTRVFMAFHLMMNIGWDFLRLEPEKWNDHGKLADYASCTWVTNNLAKRAVLLFSLYYGKFTRAKI